MNYIIYAEIFPCLYRNLAANIEHTTQTGTATDVFTLKAENIIPIINGTTASFHSFNI